MLAMLINILNDFLSDNPKHTCTYTPHMHYNAQFNIKILCGQNGLVLVGHF